VVGFVPKWVGEGGSSGPRGRAVGAHATVRAPGGLTNPCNGVGVPKYRQAWGVHMARKPHILGKTPENIPNPCKSRNFAPLDSRALKAPYMDPKGGFEW
jgi:hypothetical protein